MMILAPTGKDPTVFHRRKPPVATRKLINQPQSMLNNWASFSITEEINETTQRG